MRMPSEEALVACLYTQVHSNFQAAFGGIISGPEHLAQMTMDALNPVRAFEQLTALQTRVGQDLAGRRLLEVGCGHGLTVALARTEFGAEAYGIEPGESEFAGALGISRKVLEMSGLSKSIIMPACGEAIPFRDNWFDLVFSSNGLEHVHDPQLVIDESIRVLKPGGCLDVVVPNYGSWWEGHYGLVWLPNMPPAVAKLYVRILGRDPRFIDTLRFINYRWLKRILSKHQGRVEVLGWGVDLWEARLRTLDFSEWSTLGKLKRLLNWVHKLRAVEIVASAGKLLHWQTPLVLSLRKVH